MNGAPMGNERFDAVAAEMRRKAEGLDLGAASVSPQLLRGYADLVDAAGRQLLTIVRRMLPLVLTAEAYAIKEGEVMKKLLAAKGLDVGNEVDDIQKDIREVIKAAEAALGHECADGLGERLGAVDALGGCRKAVATAPKRNCGVYLGKEEAVRFVCRELEVPSVTRGSTVIENAVWLLCAVAKSEAGDADAGQEPAAGAASAEQEWEQGQMNGEGGTMREELAETVAGIVAEMRFHGQQNVDAEKGKPDYGILTVEGKIVLNYADRIEVAHKRERHCEKRYDQNGDEMPPHCAFDDLEIDRLQAKVGELTAELERERVGESDRLGDAVAMREALKETSELVWSSIGPECDNDCCRPLRGIARIADAALAAPPRNCDRFQTADAAWGAWMHGPGCRREGEVFVGLLGWLYAKAKGDAE